MQERFKAILEKIKAFWLKFNKTQRIVFIAVFVIVVAGIIIVSKIVSTPKKVVLRECANESEATEVRSLLNGENITCTIDANNVVRVNESDYVEAKLVLGSNNISSEGYSLSDAVSGGFSETAATTERKYKAYLESKFADDLESLDGVKAARVTIDFPESGNTVFTENEDASITAMLTLTKELSEEQAASIGLMLAANVGSDNTNNVVVMDNNANLLYYGGTNNSYATGSASSKVQERLENAITAHIQSMLISTNLYNEVTVSPHLDVSFDNVEIVDKQYTIPEGSDEGLKKTTYEVNSTGGFSDASGAAGTESNDKDTTYKIKNANGTNSEYSLKQYEWLQNEKITTTKPATGTINYDNSSVTVVATLTKYITEDDAKAQGLLDDMTWEEYKAANADPVESTVNDTFYDAIATGTGISKNNIQILGYTRSVFYDSETSSTSPFFVFQIILAVLIAGLLIFIIIRSMRPVAVEETEPELSVEDMLATTKENRQPVEDIDLQDKSETRVAIEKFVDENPEAVALLLRNWLNDGWE